MATSNQLAIPSIPDGIQRSSDSASWIMAPVRIGIIGGGIAGMAAAYELEKSRAAGQPVEYTVYEA